MSTPNDDLPLDNRAGNLYDPLFADRINALARSSGGRPAPSRPGGNGNGAGWPVGLVVVLIFTVIRGCTSLSSSSSSSYRDYKVDTPNNDELMRKIEQDREALQRQQEILKQLQERRPLIVPNDPPEGDIAPLEVPEPVKRAIQQDFGKDPPRIGAGRQNVEEEFRKLKEKLRQAKAQQAAPPAAHGEPGREP